jgi:hypothetical protein
MCTVIQLAVCTMFNYSLEADATMRDCLYKLEQGPEGADLSTPEGP